MERKPRRRFSREFKIEAVRLAWTARVTAAHPNTAATRLPRMANRDDSSRDVSEMLFLFGSCLAERVFAQVL